jgi:hypothetical protein
MKIKYVPTNGHKEIWHEDSLLAEKQYPGISTWTANETKDIPADLYVPRNVDGVFQMLNIVGALLQSPWFIRVDKKCNPNFVCAFCGAPALETHLMHERSGVLCPIEVNGKKACKPCFTSRTKLTPTGYTSI